MSEQLYLTANQVRRRYGGISDMTLWRWVRDPALHFPQPRYINRRRLWPSEALEAFDAQTAPPASGGAADA